MTIEAELRALQSMPMLSGIEPAKLKLIALVGERIDFGVGDALYRQGEESDTVYLVLNGRLAAIISTPQGDVVIAKHDGAIMLGEIGILCGEPRGATLSAETPVTALRIAAADFRLLVQDVPSFAYAVMRELARQLDTTNKQLVTHIQSLSERL